MFPTDFTVVHVRVCEARQIDSAQQLSQWAENTQNTETPRASRYMHKQQSYTQLTADDSCRYHPLSYLGRASCNSLTTSGRYHRTTCRMQTIRIPNDLVLGQSGLQHIHHWVDQVLPFAFVGHINACCTPHESQL